MFHTETKEMFLEKKRAANEYSSSSVKLTSYSRYKSVPETTDSFLKKAKFCHTKDCLCYFIIMYFSLDFLNVETCKFSFLKASLLYSFFCMRLSRCGLTIRQTQANRPGSATCRGPPQSCVSLFCHVCK